MHYSRLGTRRAVCDVSSSVLKDTSSSVRQSCGMLRYPHCSLILQAEVLWIRTLPASGKSSQTLMRICSSVGKSPSAPDFASPSFCGFSKSLLYNVLLKSLRPHVGEILKNWCGKPLLQKLTKTPDCPNSRAFCFYPQN